MKFIILVLYIILRLIFNIALVYPMRLVLYVVGVVQRIFKGIVGHIEAELEYINPANKESLKSP